MMIVGLILVALLIAGVGIWYFRKK
jgi:hypothetical protein